MPRCDTSINVHCADPELYFCRQVVDTKDHKTAKSKLVDMANIGAPGTDVATCVTADERLVAVATIGSAGKQSPGRVLLYSVGTDGKLTAIRTLTTSTGCLPDQIKWTKDCRTCGWRRQDQHGEMEHLRNAHAGHHCIVQSV